MSLPIASITTTVLVQSVSSVPAKGGAVYTLTGLVDPGNPDSVVMVTTYQKDEFIVEGLQYLVVGTPSKIGNNSLTIDARQVMPYSDQPPFSDITVGGRLGSDVQTRQFDNGSVMNANLAVKSMKETSWFSVSIWGKQPDFMTQALVKGAAICVSGSLKFESYESKSGQNAGKTVNKISVQTRRVDLLGKGMGTAETSQTSQTSAITASAPQTTAAGWDEIAF
ncbi:MAG: single-stranded DNA-binding protein [Waterburya sp.]